MRSRGQVKCAAVPENDIPKIMSDIREIERQINQEMSELDNCLINRIFV